MAKRFRIGLNFFFDNQSNSGIVNYIYNIISALNTLKDSQKPFLNIFYSSNSPINYIKEINYPFVKYQLFQKSSSNKYIRKANSIIKGLIHRDIYLQSKYFSKIDCLYPYFEFMDNQFEEAPNKIHWLVDFNNRSFSNHYYDGGESMRIYQERITGLFGEKVILSSNALHDELKSYHPNYKCDISILKFASCVPAITEKDVIQVKSKYQINDTYFMSPNQFWEHKNQEVVLKAILLIKQNNPEIKFKILFTGSQDVNRGKGRYADKLLSIMKDSDLDNYIQFLGVVDRKEQLALMKGARALIQPSFYEGWSTLVEEAKALNQYILLSDLPVHREQIDQNVTFFDPNDHHKLADIILEEMLNPHKLVIIDYSKHVQKFGETIRSTFVEKKR